MPALLALALTVTAVTYLLSSGGRQEARQGADDNVVPPPDSSRARTPRQTPGFSTPAPTGELTPTTPAEPGGSPPTELVTPGTSKAPGQPQPGPPPPTSATTPPRDPGPGPGPAPDQSGRATIPIEGQAPIHCPVPYLNTSFAALAQCTQVSGDKARVGYYSPLTREFGPSVDWMDVTEYRWFEGTMFADDGVEAEVRGYAVVNTYYGGGVFATQYRDGQARWGTVNVVTNLFYPASQGWYDVGSS